MPLELELGGRIGKCKVLELLGRGGMGAVYRARHVTLDVDVALKVITFAAATPEERAEMIGRFFREARSAAKVHHENVVAVYDVDEEAGLHYMVMELVDGTNARRLFDAGPAPIADAVRIVRDAAQALAAAHRLGIVHRDVKPENLLLTRDGRVKITDFGLAHSHADRDAKLTRTGYILGTPAYMSPEQIEGSPPLDGRADIYALGATLFHLVTGSAPYEGRSTIKVCMQHVTAAVPMARGRNPLVPPLVDAIIGRMMAKRPADRFPDGDALAAALEPFAGPRRPIDEIREK